MTALTRMIRHVPSPTLAWMMATPRSEDERVTISDVAREAGVNKGTVSRALRGVPGVGEATRTRIVEAAERLQFSASRLATALATGTSHTVGIVLPTLRSWYFTAVAAGASDVLIPSGFRVELINLDVDSDYLEVDSPQFRAMFAELGAARGRDALLFAGTVSTSSQQGSGSARVPIAAGRLPLSEVPGIFVDHRLGGSLLAGHLADLGHRDIVVLDGQMAHKPMVDSVWRDRTEGFRSELARRGIELADDAVLHPGDCRAEDGEQAMAEVLDRPRRPTAVFCHTDEMAFGAVSVLRQSGIRCPDQISVVGFDGHPMARLFGLTTVSQHAREQGVRSAQALLHALGSEPAPAHRPNPDQDHVEVELIVRETSAVPAS